MIKRTPLIFLLLLWAGTVFAHPLVLAVMGYPVKPYEEAVNGFKSIGRSDVRSFVLSENKGVDIIDNIRRKRPDIILSIGLSALDSVSGIKDIPILYMLVPDPLCGNRFSNNATGIGMNVSPAVQFEIFQKVLPDVKTIGVLYNPSKTGFLVEEALSFLKDKNLKLVAETLNQPGEISAKLNKIHPHIDAFWMLPDVTLVTPETVEILMLFSLENRIPILSFSEKYVELGALLSVGATPFDMGQQAALMAEKIFAGKGVSTILSEYARKPVVTINKKIGKKLKVRMVPDAIDGANIIQ